MTTLTQVAELGLSEQGLVVVSTLRADSTIQSSLVNAGVLAHPMTGEQVLAFVTYGKVKLANLRARPQVTTTFRSGWRWGTHDNWDEYDRVMLEQGRTAVLVRPTRVYSN